MTEISIILAGFTIVACFILTGVYLFSLPGMNKTTVGRICCALLMAAFAILQFAHIRYFLNETPLLSMRWYVLMLATTPITFYFFSRELLFHGEKPQTKDLTHGLLLLVVLVLPLPWAAVTSFAAGFCYTLYIYIKILRLRTQIPRFRFERFFFAVFVAMNVLALALGLIAPWLNPGLFYHGYAGSVSVAMILVTSALLIYPDLLTDVLLASETVYAKSKLENVNVSQLKLRLEQLMLQERIFENEDLTLTSTAEQLDISAQQLSELVNSDFGTSFPRYVRQHCVEAAKQMLVAEPAASVLSVSLATGFRSQSSFYTAFKEHTGETPAAFRSELQQKATNQAS